MEDGAQQPQPPPAPRIDNLLLSLVIRVNDDRLVVVEKCNFHWSNERTSEHRHKSLVRPSCNHRRHVTVDISRIRRPYVAVVVQTEYLQALTKINKLVYRNEERFTCEYLLILL